MKIEIINPIKIKGLGRTYTANDVIEDDSNYIELGAVVRDDEGNVLRDVVVSVEAGDQNKTMTGTGNVYPVIEQGKKIKTYYYPFHYQFKKKGNHTITFKIVGTDIKESVNITVGEKKPK